MFGWIDRLFNQHKLVRRFSVFWAMITVSLVIAAVFLNMADVTTPVASVAVSVIGLIGTVFGFYFTSRSRDK